MIVLIKLYLSRLLDYCEICMHVKKQQIESEMKQQTDCFQIREGVHQGCILSSCLLNLYAEYIMQNARLDEAQAVQDCREKYQ